MRATLALRLLAIPRKLLELLCRAAAAGVLPAWLAAVSAQAAPSFMGLGAGSSAADVSGDGSIVIGNALDVNRSRPFRWTAAGGMVFLDELPGFFVTNALATNFDGSVVVGQLNAGGGQGQAFRWTLDGGTVALGDLPGGAINSVAHAVSGDGSVVVGVGTSGSGRTAFRWTVEGGMVSIGDLAGGPLSSTAWAVSSDGSVVAGEGRTAVGTEAFRWTSSGGMVGLGDLPGGSVHSFAVGISADGSAILGLSSSGPIGGEAFRWTSGGGMVGLGDFPGCEFHSVAYDASSDGSVVVGRGSSSSCGDAFIWDANNGMRELDVVLTSLGLDLTGWRLTNAFGISDDGKTIVGEGINPKNRFEGWIAVLPEPRPPQPPVADAGGNRVLECSSPEGAGVALDGSASSDPDSEELAFTWSNSFGVRTGPTADVVLALGEHSVTLTVEDPSGLSDTDRVEISVVDTTAPLIDAIRARPDTLWPPNGRMVPVSVEVSAHDTCDPAPRCRIVDISSSEKARRASLGAAQVTGDLSAVLRAARSGRGSARTYTLGVECADASQNPARTNVEVRVPHRSPSAEPSLGECARCELHGRWPQARAPGASGKCCQI